MLSAEGARLVVSYRSNRERAEKLRGVAQVIQADLAADSDRKRLLDAAPRLYGLVILAGDPARVPAGADLRESLMRSHEANSLGPIPLARAAPHPANTAGTAAPTTTGGTRQPAAGVPRS